MSSTPTRAKIFLVLSILVLTIALGGKVLRYAKPPPRMNLSFDERLTEFVQATGWQRQAPAPNAENKAVQIITFTKTQCTHPLRISIVGTTSGLESYLRQKFGDDIAFVQHGTVRDHPSLLRYQLVGIWRGAKAFLSGRSSAAREPILAIIPAPPTNAQRCGGPPAAAWHQL